MSTETCGHCNTYRVMATVGVFETNKGRDQDALTLEMVTSTPEDLSSSFFVCSMISYTPAHERGFVPTYINTESCTSVQYRPAHKQTVIKKGGLRFVGKYERTGAPWPMLS